MMDVLARNLHLPIRPLRKTVHEDALDALINAWVSVLDYLKDNPGYFTYRFGIDEGVAVKKALKELTRLGLWVKQSGFAISLTPVRRYQNATTGALIVERGGCFPKSM